MSSTRQKSLTLFILIINLFLINAGAELKVDSKNSFLSWEASKKVGSKHNGSIALKSSKIFMKNGKLSGGEFEINMDSITVNELAPDWEKKFIGHMKSADFFEVNKYRTAKLILDKKISPLKFSGKLTIKNKTKPIEVQFSKNNLTYTGEISFDRTNFGIIYGAGNYFKSLTMDKIINNEVVVKFKILLKKK